MAKKEKYIEYDGMFHNGIDYDVYHMKARETILGLVVGAILGAVVIQIFFGIWIFTFITMPVFAVVGAFVYRNILLNKRKEKLMIQFRDMLESVSASMGSGRNVKDSFFSARDDLAAQYSEDAVIVQELDIIRQGMDNNINIEVLLQDFAKRSHNENIQNFADVFEVANRRGGNLRQIVFETKDTINEKIMVEQDIQTVISGKKNELNIMMILPLIVVNQVKGMQGNTASDLAINFMIKLAAFCIFGLAYVIGRKMMDIKV